jgi:hypothetical protein
LEFGDEGGVELFEAVLGFAFEDDGLRQEAVADAVLGRDDLAFSGGRAAGFSAVGAGGIDLALSSYDGRMGHACACGWGLNVEGFGAEEDERG